MQLMLDNIKRVNRVPIKINERRRLQLPSVDFTLWKFCSRSQSNRKFGTTARRPSSVRCLSVKHAGLKGCPQTLYSRIRFIIFFLAVNPAVVCVLSAALAPLFFNNRHQLHAADGYRGLFLSLSHKPAYYNQCVWLKIIKYKEHTYHALGGIILTDFMHKTHKQIQISVTNLSMVNRGIYKYFFITIHSIYYQLFVQSCYFNLLHKRNGFFFYLFENLVLLLVNEISRQCQRIALFSVLINNFDTNVVLLKNKFQRN